MASNLKVETDPYQLGYEHGLLGLEFFPVFSGPAEEARYYTGYENGLLKSIRDERAKSQAPDCSDFLKDLPF